MRLIPAFVLVLLAASGQPAFGQFFDRVQLARVASIQVGTALTFSPEAQAMQCNPGEDVLQAEGELVFRRSGIPVAEADILAHQFVITMTGLHDAGGCIVAYGYQLWRLEQVADSLGLVLSFEQAGLVADPSPSSVVSRLREGVSQSATRLSNEILKAQQGK